MSPEAIHERGATGQRALFVDRVEHITGTSCDVFAGDTAESSPANHEQRSGRTWAPSAELFDHWRHEMPHKAVENGDWELLPLFASSYPGTQRETDTTLWELLDGMAADTDPETLDSDSQPTRRL